MTHLVTYCESQKDRVTLLTQCVSPRDLMTHLMSHCVYHKNRVTHLMTQNMSYKDLMTHLMTQYVSHKDRVTHVLSLRIFLHVNVLVWLLNCP